MPIREFSKPTFRENCRTDDNSVVDLQAAINRFLAEDNRQPTPFTCTAEPDKIIAGHAGCR